MVITEQFAQIIHPIFETLGYMFGFQYYLRQRKRFPEPEVDAHGLWILLAVTSGALLFSRMIAVVEHVHLINATTPLSFYTGQKTIVGGLLGGLVFVEIAKKILQIKKSTGDRMVKPLLSGMILGRIGCFLSGVYDGTHGKKTEFFLGVDLGDGVVRHPVQLYEIVFLVVLFLFLSYIEKYNLKNGFLFQLFLASYLLFRFFVEFLKPVPVFVYGLSFIQITCLVGICYYLILFFTHRKKLYA
ncbi:MAG: prolipoprotein diacylglyceryl transferase family protein [Spirochaetota bacterium]